jgi:hypothetical protein
MSSECNQTGHQQNQQNQQQRQSPSPPHSANGDRMATHEDDTNRSAGGVRPTDKDPKPSKGQDEKDLGEDEGKDKDGSEGATELDPEGHQATPGIDTSIDQPD